MFEIWGFSRNLHWKSHITIFIFKDFFFVGGEISHYDDPKNLLKKSLQCFIKGFFWGENVQKK